ncbi:family 78 glycoside hydrolase catalytic domain [Pedobacter rhodius]|uniref:alpha-L-rhamnosidase n=1 Tax=Pedobacter rhodius TaxID=3004098 RepID=A0ABT4L0X0_9SPHI|nr:family 78 glycoside hydrolase catalytic domain [Pedobacter sp. SJ11]MCZ4224825.1 family 78 glycoside hydrolase catalytic domain [Pedobacter sp. SJ11]
MKKTLITFILTCLLTQLFAQVAVTGLKCEYRDNPLGIETLNPRLSWQLTSQNQNVVQTAYRILVSDNPLSLSKNLGNVWDTKKVISDASIQIKYNGAKLQPTKVYYWKVMVWDNHKNSSSWSVPSKWQMSLSGNWNGANWIAYERLPDAQRFLPAQGDNNLVKNDILPILRKEFVLKKAIKSATVYIAGLGHFDLSLNGQKVGDHFMDAGWTEFEKHALYVTFDVTKQLKQGKNAFGVMLGNGFYYVPSERYHKLTLAYGYPKMIMRTVLEFTDGSTENIISDNSWKVAPGPVTYSSIYGGEDYNATLEQTGWKMPGFNDKTWKPALVVDGPEQLTPQTATALKFFDTFTPKKVSQPKPGIWVYDLGQNASGIPKLVVKGKTGETVTLKPAELLAGDGTITTQPIGTPVFLKYTLKGIGTESWQPQFMYYGFRYVQVEGAVPEGQPNPDNLPVVTGIYGLHTRNSAATIGNFSCSNELFNKTFKLIDWAIRSNTSSVFTDCPHREKLGWLEEAHLVGPSIRYNYDIASLCRKVVRDMMNAQTPEGLVTSTAPEYARFGGPFRDSPEWGSNSVIMPWYIYEWYGDKDVLAEAYPMMKRYVAYLETKAKKHILSHGLGDWYDIGPKEPGPSQLTPNGITATATYYYDLTLMEKIANLLEKPSEANDYKNQAIEVKKAYNDAFFNEKTKQYGRGSQTANAISVYMGLVEPENKAAVVQNIVKELKEHNNTLTAGDIGYRYLLRVLDDSGRSDVIYDMNNRSDVPGYGYQLAKGATALTESWQGADNASNNHFMLGHLMEWFYSGLAGIRPAENSVGFRQIDIRPEIVGDVSAAKAEYVSPYGLIKSEWKLVNGVFELNTVIPANAKATIYLPVKANSQITKNGEIIDMNIADRNLEQGRHSIQVGSGKYLFVVKSK